MDLKELNFYYNKFKFGEDNFHNLMKNGIREILLVSTFYDAFIFEQDGRLSEQIFGEYRQLNLSTAPRITSVPTGIQALELLKTQKFDLVITMMRIGEVSPFKLAKEIKQNHPNLPILLLLNVQSDLVLVQNNEDEMKYIDDVFIWNGDTKLFLAMIKREEDKRNVEYDTKYGFVRVILLVEDNIVYYSMFLPLLYSEILKQTQRLISEELNDINKRLRMRARPKVLLVHNYEEAVHCFKKYQDYIVGVISDVKYKKNGKLDPNAGIKLIDYIHKSEKADIPITLQSSDEENRAYAHSLGANFLNKSSKTLLHDLRNIIINDLGYGDFVFRNAKGKEIDRAHTMFEFGKKLETVPEESLLYHSKRKHFSGWLIAHGEIQLAKQVRPIQIEEFENVQALREYLLDIYRQVRRNRVRGKIVNFEPSTIPEKDQIIRLADGSLGGKGRGLAFLNTLLVTMEFEKRFSEVRILLPTTAIIGTSEFDTFIEHNKIGGWITEKSDSEIQNYFLKGRLSKELCKKLEILIKNINYPLAVRSSGLLEDSQSQPFAGIYETFMLPNNHKDYHKRLIYLKNAIKLVFASVFMENARNYIESINYKVEEEKMAVIIQELVGENYDGYFYPNFSGVGQSYDFYPTSYMENSDGVVAVAVGLGKAVVEGERNFRFCPKYPKMQIISEKELLGEGQRDFYALDLTIDDYELHNFEDPTLKKLKLRVAEKHGSLHQITSVWDVENNRLVDNPEARGPKIVTFNNILKYNSFPLAKITEEILEIGEKAMGVPVEIEFAVNLKKNLKQNKFPAFYVLQIRPLTINTEEIYIDSENLDKKELFLYTESGMGNGVIHNVYDVIFADPDKFDRTQTMQMRSEVAKLNEKMKHEQKRYILIAPGRWGSRDRFLGIPVKWHEINQAKIIVEAGLKDFIVDSSQGTHFFHNLVSMNVGYFTVPYATDTDFIDWEWLKQQNPIEKTKYFVHISRPEKPFTVKMDGRRGISFIYK